MFWVMGEVVVVIVALFTLVSMANMRNATNNSHSKNRPILTWSASPPLDFLHAGVINLLSRTSSFTLDNVPFGIIQRRKLGPGRPLL